MKDVAPPPDPPCNNYFEKLDRITKNAERKNKEELYKTAKKTFEDIFPSLQEAAENGIRFKEFSRTYIGQPESNNGFWRAFIQYLTEQRLTYTNMGGDIFRISWETEFR